MALIDTEDLRKRYLFHAKVRAEKEINQIIREIKNYGSSNDRQEKQKRERQLESIKIIDNTLKDFLECEGGDSWLCIDGETYYTDVGYALEGIEIFTEVLKKRLEESEHET